MSNNHALSPHTIACPYCRASTRVVGPAVWVRPALVLTYVTLAGMLFGAVLTGFGVVMMGPVVAVLGVPVLSLLGTMSDAAPTCDACRKYLP